MHWGKPLTSNEQAWQAQPALQEEKIRLLTAPQSTTATPPPASVPSAAPVAAPAKVSPTSAPAATPATASTQAAAIPPPAAEQNALTCVEWGDFSGADLKRSEAALSTLQLGDKLSQRQIEHSIGYWVYIPPQKDKNAVTQKIAQLKTRGIEEYFVVQDKGPWLNAISLGIFKTPEAAQHFLSELRSTKDVRTAKTGERTNKFNTTLFALNGLDDDAMKKLAEIQKDFPGSELKNVPCAH